MSRRICSSSSSCRASMSSRARTWAAKVLERSRRISCRLRGHSRWSGLVDLEVLSIRFHCSGLTRIRRLMVVGMESGRSLGCRAGLELGGALTESTPVVGRQLPWSPAHPCQHSSDEFGRIACRTSPRNNAGVRQSDDNHSAITFEGATRPSSQIVLGMLVDLTSSAQSPANRGERVAPEAQDQPNPERGNHRLVKGPARVFETSPIREVTRALGSDKDTVAGGGEARIEPNAVKHVSDALLHLRIASLLPSFVVKGESLGLAVHLVDTGPHRAKPLIRWIRARVVPQQIHIRGGRERGTAGIEHFPGTIQQITRNQLRKRFGGRCHAGCSHTLQDYPTWRLRSRQASAGTGGAMSG